VLDYACGKGGVAGAGGGDEDLVAEASGGVDVAGFDAAEPGDGCCCVLGREEGTLV
jgi:hypothetical protein